MERMSSEVVSDGSLSRFRRRSAGLDAPEPVGDVNGSELCRRSIQRVSRRVRFAAFVVNSFRASHSCSAGATRSVDASTDPRRVGARRDSLLDRR